MQKLKKKQQITMNSTIENKNITWFDAAITRKDRENLHGHKGCAIWFTGLLASGKINNISLS